MIYNVMYRSPARPSVYWTCIVACRDTGTDLDSEDTVFNCIGLQFGLQLLHVE